MKQGRQRIHRTLEISASDVHLCTIPIPLVHKLFSHLMGANAISLSDDPVYRKMIEYDLIKQIPSNVLALLHFYDIPIISAVTDMNSVLPVATKEHHPPGSLVDLFEELWRMVDDDPDEN